jgi:hypothetical protein
MPHPQSRRAKDAKKKRAAERRRDTDEDRRERAERHVATEERHRVEKLRAQKRGRSRTVAVGAIGTLALTLFGYALWSELRPATEVAGVEYPTDAGRGHRSGVTNASSTPTSGAHIAQSPLCRTYPTPLDLSLAVHALEHGVVVLWYDVARPELADALVEVAERWDSHVIVSPSTGLDHPVVATAWNRLKAYPGVVPEVEDFIDAYRNRGPEDVDCDRV